MEDKRVERRRLHSREFKAEVLRACREPGASVAGVALVSAAKTPERAAEDGGGGEFVALRLPASPGVAALPDIRIELRRGATTVSVSWPTQEADACEARAQAFSSTLARSWVDLG